MNGAPDGGPAGTATAPGPITLRGGIRIAAMKIHREPDKVVFSQKTRLWFRLAAFIWVLCSLMTPLMLYSQLFTTQTTRFTCDRASDQCAVNGQPKDLPRLSALKRAVLSREFNRRDGANYGIDLVTGDGKKYSIDAQRAIKQSAIDNYSASVKAINAFLADPSRQALDTSFTFQASIGEIVQSFFYLAFEAVTVFLLFLIWTRRIYTFEPDRVSMMVSRPFLRTRQEIQGYRVTAVVNHAVVNRRLVELKLDSGYPIAVVETWRADGVTEIATELSRILGKPLETVGD